MPALTRAETTAVNVFVRVRAHHQDVPSCTDVHAGDNGRSEVTLDSRTFHFDKAGGVRTSQSHIFNVIGRPTLDAFLAGYNGAVLCYGQSGAGKTYTMIGDDAEERGLLPRMLEEAFGELARRQKDLAAAASAAGERVFFRCACSHLQIHNDQITDLLAPATQLTNTLRVRESPDHGTYVEGLKEVRLRSAADALRALATSAKRRTVASTAMNDASSRSHAVFILKLQRVSQPAHGEPPVVRTSQLNLVDLAGSERQVKVAKAAERARELHGRAAAPAPSPVDGSGEGLPRGLEGFESDWLGGRCEGGDELAAAGNELAPTRSRAASSALPSGHTASSTLEVPPPVSKDLLQEACSINRSLSALVGVIQALNAGKSHVPYRDSKLTMLLRDSLGGSARTWLIVCA